MEPTAEQVVYIAHAVVTEVGVDGNMSFFITNRTAMKWYSVGECAFLEGDRVKITITKEPTDAIPR